MNRTAADNTGEVVALEPAYALVEFRDVAKHFVVGGALHPAIEGVNLRVRRGEIVTLVGPSGCGKSTLLNMTAGLFGPTRGKVLYRGAEVTGLNHSVGYMTQQDHLLPWRTVLENIALPLELRGEPADRRLARVTELIGLVGLDGFERHYPAQISGGMRKRCALARLLAYDPETLLMDEPFAALDAQLRLGLQIELLRLVRELGKTVLFVTHDLDEAIALADRCVVFQGRPGRIVETLEVDLPAERDLMTLRFDARYVRLTQSLWRIMAPDLIRATGARQAG
ncbi:MAG: ABC transporter ATP-binding protein [Elioraea sp.]|nr:ABC transporter ATP-binding protein [Elioraea sp.]